MRDPVTSTTFEPTSTESRPVIGATINMENAKGTR